MLDARTICSGATGRNGGHVKAVPEISYADLVPLIGKQRAREVVEFTLANVEALFQVSETLSPELKEYCEIRRANTLNVFTDSEGFDRAVGAMEKFDEDIPELAGRMRVVGKGEMEERYGIKNSYGGTASRAGAAWPYRLITGILAELLEKYSFNFRIEANTPVESIEYRNGTYQVKTPRGVIKANKIIHATNGHAAHLLPGLRGHLFPIRGQMTAQTPHPEFGIPENSQSWSIHYGKGFDYITQSRRSGGGEIFIGGALVRSDPLQELGNPRDDENALLPIAHLGGIMDATFGRPVCGEVKAAWTGTMGFTADGMPDVGQVTEEVSGRKGEGEFVAAGYNGYGMANAWLCGRFVADLVQGRESEVCIPRAYKLTGERLAGMNVRGAAGYWLDTFGGV